MKVLIFQKHEPTLNITLDFVIRQYFINCKIKIICSQNKSPRFFAFLCYYLSINLNFDNVQ